MSEFKVLKTYPIKSYGTTHEYIEIVQCPRCKNEFPRNIKSGCFNDYIDPEFCPKCNYPLPQEISNWNDKNVNPSKR